MELKTMQMRTWGSFFRHFELARSELIALAGGGGKTTLLHALALHLFRIGGRVLVGTTTKINTPRLPTLSMRENADFAGLLRDVKRAFQHRRLLALLMPPPVDSTKRTGPDPDQTDRLWTAHVATHFVTEADGSRQMPLKAWAAHEPPVPSRTTLFCSVLGADRLNEALDEEHVFRLDVLTQRFGLRAGDVLTPERLALLMNSPLGGLKNAPRDARKILFLNRADLIPPLRRSELAERFLPELAERLRGWDRILLGSLHQRRIDHSVSLPKDFKERKGRCPLPPSRRAQPPCTPITLSLRGGPPVEKERKGERVPRELASLGGAWGGAPSSD